MPNYYNDLMEDPQIQEALRRAERKQQAQAQAAMNAAMTPQLPADLPPGAGDQLAGMQQGPPVAMRPDEPMAPPPDAPMPNSSANLGDLYPAGGPSAPTPDPTATTANLDSLYPGNPGATPPTPDGPAMPPMQGAAMADVPGDLAAMQPSAPAPPEAFSGDPILLAGGRDEPHALPPLPHKGIGSWMKANLPRLAQAGIAGAARPNVAGGSAVDIFGAMQAGGATLKAQDDQAYARATGKAKDDIAAAHVRSQIDLAEAQAEHARMQAKDVGHDKVTFSERIYNEWSAMPPGDAKDAKYKDWLNAMGHVETGTTQKEKLEQAILKPWGTSVQIQDADAPMPEGMEVTKSLTQPGKVWVHPPAYLPLPAGLVKFAPGRAVGQMMPYAEFLKVQQRADDDLIKNQDHAQNNPLIPGLFGPKGGPMVRHRDGTATELAVPAGTHHEMTEGQKMLQQRYEERDADKHDKEHDAAETAKLRTLAVAQDHIAVYQDKEDKLWTTVNDFEKKLSTSDNEFVANPFNGNMMKMTPELRKSITEHAKGLRNQIKGIQKNKDDLVKAHRGFQAAQPLPGELAPPEVKDPTASDYYKKTHPGTN